jgi:acyl-CoA reductase-like NAD-dependent aldehyde dehydrogenase
LSDVFVVLLGHSTDLVQFVTGYGETGSALVTAVNKVLFIGSPGVGKKVMEAASKSLTPVTLELGGKDPFIVCDDCDLPYTIAMALRGAFLNCGQNCLSAERFYVYDKVYDTFIQEVLKVMPTLSQGPNKPDVGAINMPAQVMTRHLIACCWFLF